jgi:hypothetical protein
VTKTCIFLFLPCMLHTLPILPSCLTTVTYLVKHMYFETPHYTQLYSTMFLQHLQPMFVYM